MAFLRIPDLLPGSTYNFQVRSKNDDEVSEWSVVWSVVVDKDTVPPKAPANVTWVSVGDAFVGEWDAVTENTDNLPNTITRYEVELVANSTTRILSVVPVTGEKPRFELSFEQNSSLFSGPRPAVTFRVRAVNTNEVKSAWSDLKNASNPKPGAPLSPDTGSVATGGQGAVFLRWKAPNGATDTDIIGYNIYSGTTSGFTPAAGNRRFSGQGNSFTYGTASYGFHYFKIFSVDKFGQESDTFLDGSAEATNPFVIDTTPPGAPTAFSVNIFDDPAGVLLTQNAEAYWEYNTLDTSIKGFHFQYRKFGEVNWRTVVVLVQDFAPPAVLVRGLEPNVEYEFRVRAYDEYANYSAWANFNTDPEPPTVQPTLFHSIEIGGGGFIQSQDYDGVGGGFGFYMDDNELNINNGVIRGETISVGSIRSNQLAVFPDGTTQAGVYKWQIDLDGDAILGNAWVRGNLIVGENDETKMSVVQSANYEEADTSAGWIIRSDGSARFNKVDADSFDGSAIKAESLEVSKLSSGDLSAGINLEGNGGIYSTGILGQTVKMSSDGFSVISPPYCRITNIEIAAPTVNLTVDIANTFSVGDWVRVLNIPDYVSPNDIFQVTAVSGGGTIVTIEVPGSSSIPGTAVQGQLYGGLSGAGKQQDILVEFPSDGLRPNIVSGTLTGDTILSKENFVIFNTGSIEVGASLELSAGIKNPTTTINISSELDSNEVASVASGGTGDIGDPYIPWIPVATEHNSADGHYYTMAVKSWETTTHVYLACAVYQYNIGTRQITQVMPKTQIKAVPKTNGLGTNWNMAGFAMRNFVYAGGHFWSIVKMGGLTTTGEYKERHALVKFNSSTFATTFYGLTLTNGFYADWMIGRDYTNANNLLYGRTSVADTGNDREIVLGGMALVRSATEDISVYNISVSGGVPSNGGSSTSEETALGFAYKVNHGAVDVTLNNIGISGYHPIVSMRTLVKGTFDFGSTKYILKDRGSAAADSMWYHVYSSVGTRETNLEWRTVEASTMTESLLWNPSLGRFFEMRWEILSNSLVKAILFEYVGGTATWTDTRNPKTFWVGYSWYDSVTPVQETQIGGTKSISIHKRRSIRVTIPQIPYRGTDDYPDRARIWAAQATNRPALTSTSWKKWAEIFYPSTTTLLKMMGTVPSDVPKSSNDFAVVGTNITPSQIVSATGNSFWKGDDTAQFYQLVLKSNADATSTANNKPPLRIGDPAGTHLRIDGNEIIAMLGNSSQGAFILNAGGQVNITDLNVTGSVIGGLTGTGTLVMGSIRGSASVIDLSYEGGGLTGASINNNGRIVRTTSSARYKDNITPMSLETARGVLALEPVTFTLKEEVDRNTTITYPGFIAEQAAEVGADLWVFHNHEGAPEGFRYAELTAAHNLLLRELYDKIDELQNQIDNMK